MATPRVLWIRRVEGSPTADIGSFTSLNERFQFFGSVAACSEVPAEGAPRRSKKDKPLPRRWHAILHRFRLSGAYVGTDSWAAPLGLTDEEAHAIAREHLSIWIGKLRGLSYQDIHIRPFAATIDGVAYGLTKVEKGLTLALRPNEISFSAPWAGDVDVRETAPTA